MGTTRLAEAKEAAKKEQTRLKKDAERAKKLAFVSANNEEAGLSHQGRRKPKQATAAEQPNFIPWDEMSSDEQEFLKKMQREANKLGLDAAATTAEGDLTILSQIKERLKELIFSEAVSYESVRKLFMWLLQATSLLEEKQIYEDLQRQRDENEPQEPSENVPTEVLQHLHFLQKEETAKKNAHEAAKQTYHKLLLAGDKPALAACIKAKKEKKSATAEVWEYCRRNKLTHLAVSGIPQAERRRAAELRYKMTLVDLKLETSQLDYDNLPEGPAKPIALFIKNFMADPAIVKYLLCELAKTFQGSVAVLADTEVPARDADLTQEQIDKCLEKPMQDYPYLFQPNALSVASLAGPDTVTPDPLVLAIKPNVELMEVDNANHELWAENVAEDEGTDEADEEEDDEEMENADIDSGPLILSPGEQCGLTQATKKTLKLSQRTVKTTIVRTCTPLQKYASLMVTN